MTNTKDKKTEYVHTDVVEASKTLVSQTKTWATTVREAWLTPLTNGNGNQLTSMMVEPWVAMTRATHEQWLNMYESQSHEMIDRSYQTLQQMQKIPPFPHR